jgi:hypothetical protein
LFDFYIVQAKIIAFKRSAMDSSKERALRDIKPEGVMQTLKAQHQFNAPIATVWEFLEDFTNIEAWWPRGGPVDIERVEIEDSPEGVIRHIYNVGFADAVSERLDFIDSDNHILMLSIVADKPAGLRHYQATGRLVATESGCIMYYSSEFLTESGSEAVAEEFLSGAYQLMFAGLEQALAR